MHTDSERGLEAWNIYAEYHTRTILHDVTVKVEPGEAVAVVGPNGAGKTTLLKVLSGLLKPAKGKVVVDGVDIGQTSRRHLSRIMAVVPQRMDAGFGLSAREVVAMGRTPYVGFLGGLSATDQEAIMAAAEETEVLHVLDRTFSSLSGGEQQRVILAMALAQQPAYLLLDEPTVHLDLGQQWKLMERLRSLRFNRGVGILAIIHDLSLAGTYFDHLVLLDEGVVVSHGPPEEVLTPGRIQSAFGAPISVLPHDSAVRVVLDPEFKDHTVHHSLGG